MKKYTIEAIETDEGELIITRHVQGFHGLECLGIIALIQENLIGIIKGEIPQPKYITTREKETE